MLYFFSVHPPTHPRTLIPHRPPTSKPETMGFPVSHFRGALCIALRAPHDPKLGGMHLRPHRTSPPSKKGKNTLSGCEITQFRSSYFSPFPPIFPPIPLLPGTQTTVSSPYYRHHTYRIGGKQKMHPLVTTGE